MAAAQAVIPVNTGLRFSADTQAAFVRLADTRFHPLIVDAVAKSKELQSNLQDYQASLKMLFQSLFEILQTDVSTGFAERWDLFLGSWSRYEPAGFDLGVPELLPYGNTLIWLHQQIDWLDQIIGSITAYAYLLEDPLNRRAIVMAEAEAAAMPGLSVAAVSEVKQFHDWQMQIFGNCLSHFQCMQHFSNDKSPSYVNLSELKELTVSASVMSEMVLAFQSHLPLEIASIVNECVEQQTLLMRLAKSSRGYGDAIRLLKTGFVSLGVENEDGETALSIAKSRANEPMVALLRAYGATEPVIPEAAAASSAASSGQSPSQLGALVSAILGRNVDRAMDLIAAVAEVNGLDQIDPSSGHTPLTAAVSVEQTGLAEMLLQNGATRDFANRAGETPIELSKGLADYGEMFNLFNSDQSDSPTSNTAEAGNFDDIFGEAEKEEHRHVGGSLTVATMVAAASVAPGRPPKSLRSRTNPKIDSLEPPVIARESHGVAFSSSARASVDVSGLTANTESAAASDVLPAVHRHGVPDNQTEKSVVGREPELVDSSESLPPIRASGAASSATLPWRQSDFTGVIPEPEQRNP